jgi:GMP synthase-like glutamine amidotransferase
MRALFVQQDHVSPVGPVGERFAERGYEVEEFLVVPPERFHDPGVEVSFPDPLDYDVIVPMGAPWSVYDEATVGAWVLEEIGLLRRAHDAGVPVLGICFGGQALATALGGTVGRAPEPEIGWFTVHTDEPDLVEPGPWFQWHHDRWTTPPTARPLAHTERAPQAFTLGRSMAVQFHPELVGTMLAGWLDNGGAPYMREHGIDPDAVVARTMREEPAAIERSRRLVDRFIDRVATGTPATPVPTSGHGPRP